MSPSLEGKPVVAISSRAVFDFEEENRVFERDDDAAYMALQRDGGIGGMRIRTALVSVRSAPAHERAIRTLMDWGVGVDEAMFLGGLAKGPFLRRFEPDFYFDDQTRPCESAAQAGPTGHVVSGIANRGRGTPRGDPADGQ